MKVVFVVPFFFRGDITQMRVYSDVERAQRALRRYVGYSKLLAEVRRAHPNATRTRAMVAAFGAIHGTPYAGTMVYEIMVDDKHRVRQW
jgi:hypothetical protein